MWGVLICLFTMKTFGVNYLILLALLYENIVAVLTRMKNFASMKKCENVMLLFSHTGVIVNNGALGGQKLRFYQRKKSKKQQTSLAVSAAFT